jgi:hypothetical protein
MNHTIRLWAKRIGVQPNNIRAVLADAYLQQHDIPLGLADDERAAHQLKAKDAHQMG